jgi:hypothetical protein
MIDGLFNPCSLFSHSIAFQKKKISYIIIPSFTRFVDFFFFGNDGACDLLGLSHVDEKLDSNLI